MPIENDDNFFESRYDDDEDYRLEKSGTFVGTPLYVPPEMLSNS